MGLITVSRTHGSGGTTFARELARTLGYECVTRSALEQSCREEPGDALACGLADEESPSFLEKLEELMDNRNFHKIALMANIYHYALRDNVIFIGMGSHIVLSGVRDVINLQVVRRLSDRVRAIAGLKGTSYDDALGLIEKMDKGKKDFVEHYYGRDIMDPTQYHLIINSSFVSLEDAIHMAADYARRCFAQALPPDARSLLENRLLEKKAETLLFRLEMVHDYVKVSFESKGEGVLAIKGVVGGAKEKDRLIHAVEALKGVKSVEDHLKTEVLSRNLY